MAHPLVACFLVSGIAAAQAIVTCAIDLNRTHATHPLWPPHARFHIVWQVFSTVFLSIGELALIWWPGPIQAARFYLAGSLIAVGFLAFWLALASAHLYRGALFDQHGMLPIPIHVRDTIVEVEMNRVAVAVGSLVLIAAIWMYR